MMRQVDSPQNESALSILTTKTYQPQVRPDTLPRYDLVDKLSSSVHRKLTVVCAPAGYGKTTAVASWLQQTGLTPAWVSLDSRDNDPMTLWSTILIALESVHPNLPRNAWDYLQLGLPASSDTLTSVLIHDAYQVQGRVFIVLDDYHLIHEPVIHATIENLIRRGPSTLHFIITSRSMVPFSLGKLRSQGQILELTARDLRFDKQAILEFYRKVMGIELSREELDLVEYHTEGWAAGMNLVALALQGTSNSTAFLRSLTGDHRFIADYLAEEVIHFQPHNIQSFWLRTSVLSRLCGPLCEAVTGDPNAGQILRELQQSSSFLIPLDDNGQWFRYHHLFAGALQEQLLRRFPNEVVGLHKMACSWFESMNLIPEAVDHAFRGRDFKKAATLMNDHAPKMIKAREISTLRGWLKEFPEGYLKQDPQTCITYGWVLALSGHLEPAEQFVGLVDEYVLQNAIPQGEWDKLWVESQVLRGYIACLRNDVKRAIDCFARSTERSPKYSRFFRYGAELNAGEPYVLRSRLGLRGYLTGVAELYPTLRGIWKNSGLGILGYGSVALAELHYEWNEFDQLAYFIPRGIELGKMFNIVGILVPMYFVYARHLRATNKQSDMWLVLADLKKILHDMNASSHWINVVGAFKTRLWIDEQNREKVDEWVASSPVTMEDECYAIKEFELITLARALLYQGRLIDAVTLLVRLERWAETEDRLGSLIEILILQSILYRQRGDLTEALAIMERAVSIALPHKYQRTFLDEGAPVVELLHSLLEQERDSQSTTELLTYVQMLLSVVNMEPSSSSLPTSPTHQSGALIEPLTKRENTTLQMLSKGHTNAEIAAILGISVGTVKGYTHHIFGKLGVRNRTEAVAKAKSMNLLKPTSSTFH
ncbi:LuxR C-terminal-related transcriptional regulator [Alicyclobacillus dauci]|uniref:LuxR C-terminal-related transcriptional regulator n=1 Tax=Alicyclobacillus dauci TaxID=1475485 RepID=A0ABY6Z259_9BACL|nr:LuxR C-terminal-related transcriptional regulator [Alicyclobacillus dauci]WAH36772.1 LuxR C-terminal-related transcriptional regulator [Alicyclobacillus dauci]